MANMRTHGLTALRSRTWRLTALVLWAALLLVNLGAAMGQGPVLHDGFDSQICSEAGHGGSSAPAPASDHGSDHAAGPHCPLCYVFSAGVLAPPSGEQVLVLSPASGWHGLNSEILAAPAGGLSRKGPLPRAPPVLV